MRHIKCEICGNDQIPQNDSLSVNGTIHCNSCFEGKYKTEEDIKGLHIDAEPDPTVCAFCQKDNLSIPLDTIGGMPTCNDCKETVYNRPYPAWVKGMFAFALVLVVFSFIWNFKYYTAYEALNNHFLTEDYDEAVLSLNTAYSIVPENEDIKALWIYYESIRLMSVDSAELAYLMLLPYELYYPAEFEAEELLLTAKIAMTFDKGDYDLFLDATQERLKFYDKSATSYLSVASGFAANYAEPRADIDITGFADSARVYINKALEIGAGEGEDIQEYINRIEHRLHTKEILTFEEFYQQFPNGWTK